MLLCEFCFPSILQIWYVEVRISRSISESPLEFEITSRLYFRLFYVFSGSKLSRFQNIGVKPILVFSVSSFVLFSKDHGLSIFITAYEDSQ